jgi:hypothetical protein
LLLVVVVVFVVVLPNVDLYDLNIRRVL